MKRKLILITFVILIIALGICFSCVNFYLGSNSRHFASVFEYTHSKWHSYEHNISAQVYEDEYMYMLLTCGDSNEEYILLSLDNFNSELYAGGDIKKALQSSPICRPVVKAKKRWGKVYGFDIKNVLINSKEFKKITFNKM